MQSVPYNINQEYYWESLFILFLQGSTQNC